VNSERFAYQAPQASAQLNAPQDAALHAIWHLVLGVDLDQDVPYIRRQASLAIFLLEGLNDLHALLDQPADDGREVLHFDLSQ